METPAHPAEQDADEIRRQLARIVRSAGFARSQRLILFLRFVVEKALIGDTGSIQEYVIGMEVFGRRESFDPKRGFHCSGQSTPFARSLGRVLRR